MTVILPASAGRSEAAILVIRLPKLSICNISPTRAPSGVRLGRGSGFYDRSLGFRDPQSRLVAIVRDSELVDELPSEPHDVPMTHALTPGRGLVTLPTRE